MPEPTLQQEYLCVTAGLQQAAELHMQMRKQGLRGEASMPAALQIDLPDNEGILRVMCVGLGSRHALAAVGALLR